MSDIIKFARHTSVVSGSSEALNELTGGVVHSFPIISFRGRVWRIKAKGIETIVTNSDGDPAASLRAVILKASAVASKIHYDKAYEEGDDGAPRCFSVDGVKPDSSIADPIHANCSTCPKNVWGSKITATGAEVKDCADNRRVVVTPTGDMHNELAGGPMLLRVPPASIRPLADYAVMLGGASAEPFEVSTKISFDTDASYPKLVFDFDRQLSEEETALALELRESDATKRILQSSADVVPAAAATTTAAAAAPAKTKAKAKAVLVVDEEEGEEVGDEVEVVASGEDEGAEVVDETEEETPAPKPVVAKKKTRSKKAAVDAPPPETKKPLGRDAALKKLLDL